MSLMDALVFSAVGCGVVFFIAWLLLPNLRAWIERPKYRFQANLEDYDRQIRDQGIGEIVSKAREILR